MSDFAEIKCAVAPLDPTFTKNMDALRVEAARMFGTFPSLPAIQIFTASPGSREALEAERLFQDDCRLAPIPQKAAARFLASLPDVEGEKLDADLAALSDYAAEHALRS